MRNVVVMVRLAKIDRCHLPGCVDGHQDYKESAEWRNPRVLGGLWENYCPDKGRLPCSLSDSYIFIFSLPCDHLYFIPAPRNLWKFQVQSQFSDFIMSLGWSFSICLKALKTLSNRRILSSGMIWSQLKGPCFWVGLNATITQ
jgi:hypothetical protein